MIEVDRSCPTCGREIGRHLVSEWVTCAGRNWDLPYEGTPETVTFSLEGRDIVIADTITVRALVAGDDGQTMGLRMPVVLMTFGVGRSNATPHEVAEIAFVGTPAGVRKMGVLVRDGANGAANRAETMKGRP